MTWSAQREMLLETVCVLVPCWFILKHAFTSFVLVLYLLKKILRTMKLGTQAYFELRTCAFKFAYCSSICCFIFIQNFWLLCDIPSISTLILNLDILFSINYTQKIDPLLSRVLTYYVFIILPKLLMNVNYSCKLWRADKNQLLQQKCFVMQNNK